MTVNARNPLQLGVVPYLNVQPLIWSFISPQGEHRDDVRIAPARPSELAIQLHRGDHHAAIVPVFEYLQNPLDYRIVPGVSIAARTEVYSVLLFSSVPLQQISRVHLDAASLTSVNLTRILLTENKIAAAYVTGAWQPGHPLRTGDAALLIGDPAIQERGKHPYQFDLQVLWHALTGLPFVFAAWLVHRSAWQREINQLLIDARLHGMAHLEEIAVVAGPQFGIPAPEALNYYRQNLCYDLGPEELEGFRRFGELCARHHLIPAAPELHMHDL
jgi:chorismate dehydratase